MNGETKMGRRLRIALAEKAMTQSEFARKLGVTRQAVTAYCKAQCWRSTTTSRIAGALKKRVEYFFMPESEG